MINQELQNYISQSRQAGVEDNAIRQALLGSGFLAQDIDEAMIDIGMERNILENMQNQKPLVPERISEPPLRRSSSKLGRIVKVIIVTLVILAGLIGGYFALTNYFPQYAKFVQPYVGPILDQVVDNLITPFCCAPTLNPTLTFTPTPTIIPTYVPIQSPQIIDSDNDGLSDEDEAKYKTDPSKPDTDGDGYPDGEEVQNGYNPLGPGRASP